MKIPSINLYMFNICHVYQCTNFIRMFNRVFTLVEPKGSHFAIIVKFLNNDHRATLRGDSRVSPMPGCGPNALPKK